jgi:cytochrome P450
MSLQDLDALDLSDLSHFRTGAPHALFARMRDEAPVHWSSGPDGQGFWSLTRHADVLAVSRAADDFVIEPHGNMIFDQFGEGDTRGRMMLERDAPAHTRYRKLVNRDFSSRQVARLLAFAEKRVGEILDEALEQGHVDFVSDVAGRLPTALIAELMGVPESDRQALYEIANRVMAFSDPEFSDATGGANMEAIGEMLAFAADLAGQRRRAPREDLMSELLEAEIEGDRLCDEEIEYFFLLLITAGIETTRSAISAGMLAFHDAPREWRRLRSQDVSMKAAVEEVVRFTAPIHHFRRTAGRDVKIADREIEAGSRVVIWYSSANRDERVFRDPQRFDAGRTPNEHLSFGFGRHFCLGASLARMEIGAMLQGLLERDVQLELSGEVEWMASNFAQSPKRMPVVLSRSPG